MLGMPYFDTTVGLAVFTVIPNLSQKRRIVKSWRSKSEKGNYG